MRHEQTSDETTSAWRRFFAARFPVAIRRPLWHGIAVARCALVGSGLLATGCAPETGISTSWSVSFACAAHAAQSESVKVEIAPETCASTAAPVYRATIRREGGNRMAAPPDLAAGTYAFSATAYNSDGETISATCSEVALPSEHGVMLVLPGPEGCVPAMGHGGAHAGDGQAEADAGDGQAEGPFDAGGADAAACAGSCAKTVYSSPTQDISLPKQCWAPGEFMPVTIHMPVTAKDWLWVKNHPDYGGNDREFWDYTGITKASAVYRGGEREPMGLHAPTTPGSFSITWHPNDTGDKEVRSTLDFTVSRDCP